jgi:hypothetical protein
VCADLSTVFLEQFYSPVRRCQCSRNVCISLFRRLLCARKCGRDFTIVGTFILCNGVGDREYVQVMTRALCYIIHAFAVTCQPESSWRSSPQNIEPCLPTHLLCRRLTPQLHGLPRSPRASFQDKLKLNG